MFKNVKKVHLVSDFRGLEYLADVSDVINEKRRKSKITTPIENYAVLIFELESNTTVIDESISLPEKIVCLVYYINILTVMFFTL